MIRYLYADQLVHHPVLADSMYKDRTDQFKNRLNWDVIVNERGWETDEYDEINPLYVIWEETNGRHGGSMRVLPTVGRTMTGEHFTHLTDGVAITSPLIWECTRFCLGPTAGSGVAAALMLAGCELGLRFGLEQAIGVFDGRMPRIYARLGWRPDIIGSQGAGREMISIGLWSFAPEIRAEISRRSAIPVALARSWFDRSFQATLPFEAVA